jgi:hypothetical protein
MSTAMTVCEKERTIVTLAMGGKMRSNEVQTVRESFIDLPRSGKAQELVL